MRLLPQSGSWFNFKLHNSFETLLLNHIITSKSLHKKIKINHWSFKVQHHIENFRKTKEKIKFSTIFFHSQRGKVINIRKWWPLLDLALVGFCYCESNSFHPRKYFHFHSASYFPKSFHLISLFMFQSILQPMKKSPMLFTFPLIKSVWPYLSSMLVLSTI